jgi:prepilin-type N-terminal cleavage/methylation domain-containing protein
MSQKAPHSRVRRSEVGMSLVELLVVMFIIAVLVTLAVPMYINFIRRGEAAKIVADFHSFETAVMQYNTDKDGFPPDRLAGQNVPELFTYLGDRIKYRGPRWQYDWENWIQADGSPLHPATGIAYGFTVETSDPRLVDALFRNFTGAFWATMPNRYTFAIVTLGDS